MFVRLSIVCVLGMLSFAPVKASAQSADNVLLVINDSSPASTQIADYYASKRSIPKDHVVHLQAPVEDAIPRAQYLRAIETPIAAWLAKNRLQDEVLYIVLTKGVPLRVAGTDGQNGTTASVDSELTLLYRKLLGLEAPLLGRLPNPYFLGDKPVSEARPMTRFASDIYLVTRLDGFTVDDVLRLIDRGVAPSPEGQIVLDQKATLIDRGGDQWLQQASDRLRQTAGDGRVVLETSTTIASATGPVIGYYSWGSNDPANQARKTGLSFANGAIGGTFVSTDGRTFAEPPATWKPSDPNGRGPRWGGSFQSLSGDLIRDGITGVSGHVAEPYLDATIRPQVLFPAYLAGFNLAEAFYLAMPFLSWQTVVIGDPLCAPFAKKILPANELHTGLDNQTESPALFVERRLIQLSKSGLNTEALKLSIKAEGLLARGNQSEAEKMLEQATAKEPKLIAGHLALAEFHEQRAEYDKAGERYRRILASDSQNSTALNNLAYMLAERAHTPKEALPYAEKAFRLNPAEPAVLDTLGWTHHLLGDDKAALPYIERAVLGGSGIPDILIHAAAVHIGVGDYMKAKAELDVAEKLNAAVAGRADVKALRERLK